MSAQPPAPQPPGPPQPPPMDGLDRLLAGGCCGAAAPGADLYAECEAWLAADDAERAS